METITLQHVHKEVVQIQHDLELIKNILSEEGKLTEEAKKKLAKARATPDSEYMRLEELD